MAGPPLHSLCPPHHPGRVKSLGPPVRAPYTRHRTTPAANLGVGRSPGSRHGWAAESSPPTLLCSQAPEMSAEPPLPWAKASLASPAQIWGGWGGAWTPRSFSQPCKGARQDEWGWGMWVSPPPPVVATAAPSCNRCSGTRAAAREGDRAVCGVQGDPGGGAGVLQGFGAAWGVCGGVQLVHPKPAQQQQHWGPLPRARANGGASAIRAGQCGLTGHGTWPRPRLLGGAAPRGPNCRASDAS